MSWLLSRQIPNDARATLDGFLTRLENALADPSTDRDELCREILAELMYGRPYATVLADSPVAALNLDPRNVTLESEHYAATDPERFGRVKPLLWLWKNADLTPAGQSLAFGIPFRRILARHVFNRVGRNFKCFQNVEFSVGYNLEVGDDVVIHRNVLVDDIGGVTLHDEASLSDFVNVYSHTHSALEPSDVTLKHTTIGRGVRVTYHATVLAGTTLSDDSMIGTMSVVTRDVEPSRIAFGIPARTRRIKVRPVAAGRTVDSRTFRRPPDRKGDPAHPEFRDSASESREIGNDDDPSATSRGIEGRVRPALDPGAGCRPRS